MHGKLGGDTTWTDYPNQPDIPVDIPVHKVGERRRKGVLLEGWGLFSQVTTAREGALLSWRWLNTWVPPGKQ